MRETTPIDQLPDRIPPHNLDAERAVLGGILLHGAGALQQVGALTPADFYLGAHREIFGTFLAMAAGGGALDSVTVCEELRRRDQLQFIGGPAALALLVEQGSISVYLASYAAIIRQHATLRETIQAAAHILDQAFDATEDAQLVVDQARERFEVLAHRAVAAEAPFPARSAAELAGADLPLPAFHVEGWIPTKGITFVVGDSEAFKSWLAQYIGLCVAAGRPLFDRFPTTQAPTLMLSEENGVVEDRRRLQLLGAGMGFELAGLPCYIASETAFSFDDAPRYASLRRFVQELGIRLVLIDSFVRVHRREEKDAGQMNALYMDRMKPLIRDGVDLLLLHHKRKLPAGMHGQSPATSDSDDIRGSGDLRAAAHAVLFLKTLSKTTVVVRHNKARGFEKQDPFVFSLAGGNATGQIVLTHEGAPAEAVDKTAGCRAAILEYAAEHPAGFFRQDVVTALKGKFSKRVVDPVLKTLAKDSYPLKEDEIRQGRSSKKFYRLVSAAPDEPAGEDDGDVPF